LSAGLNRKKEKGWKKQPEGKVEKNQTSKEAKAYPEATGICLPL
jgi:hypothetical protein